MEEIWKDIDGFEGSYQVSNFGGIKSLSRKVNSKNNFPRIIKERTLTPVKKQNKYLSISLGNHNQKDIHRLVAQAFIPNPDNKKTVNHKNGIKNDNRVENLEWATYTENIRHAFKSSLNVPLKGEERYNSKLTEDDVFQILQLNLMYGLKQTVVAKEYGVSIGMINVIIKRKAWKHIQI